MKGANFLEKLLDNQPVEWKKLGEVATFYGGLTGKSKEDFTEGNAYYISYKNIYENIAVDATCLERVNVGEGERQHTVEYGDVLITGSSENLEEAGMSSSVTFESETNIYLNSFSFGIRFNEGIELSPEFTKYLFRTNMMRKQIMSTAQGVTRFNVSKKRFATIEIPIPPLSVQSRIVEILDKFTSLEAELEAELEARTLQYEYYRDSLFEALDCPRVPLGSFAQLVRGSGMPKTDFSESGVGAIHYGQIYTKFGTATAEVITHVPEEKAKKLAVVNPGDVIVANTSENLEDVCKAVAWVGDSDIVTGGHATVIKAPEQNAKFISYYMATGRFNKDKRRHAFGTKVIDVAPKNLAKIEFPVPPLEEQQRIVDILDRFDALTSSLSEGLPAELAARRSQYEYYRDQLLSFPRKGENQ